MKLRTLTVALVCIIVATIAWASSGLWTTGTASDPQGGIPTLDQRARALTPETSCLAPVRRADSGPSPRCVVAFGRAVGALGVPPEGTPAVVSLVHAATGSWALPGATYVVGFEPLPAEAEAQVILASTQRDAALLAVGADLMRYEISTGRMIARAAGPGGMIDDLGWSVDGAWIVLAAGGKAAVVDSNGKLVRQLPIEGRALHVAIDANAAHAAVGSDVGGVTIFGHATEAAPRTVTPSLQPPAELAFAAGRLWVAGADGILRALDPATGEETAHVEIGTPIVKLAIAADGTRAATAGRDRTVRLHELPSGKIVAELAWHQAQVLTLGWGAGPTLVSGDGDGELAVWDVGAIR